ncbi:MAG: hypothetical protein CMM47_00685 [Rhodospirillaceae bacterium]|nr:hypothetical protein [Rhodospirillaceae bacterium]MBM84488.1 hypothetical protein [Rhodospirillaceae bacterium]MBM84525.1 hypothetical protein [Rhodospirillaceae bacterium]
MRNYTITNKGVLNRLLLRAQTLHHAVGYELGKPPEDAVDADGNKDTGKIPVLAKNMDTGESVILEYTQDFTGVVWTGYQTAAKPNTGKEK